MDELFNAVKAALEGIQNNTGTVEAPVLVRVLKKVEEDEGQFDNKVDINLPAVTYDATELAYSQAAENIGLADTELTIKIAMNKTDNTRWAIINQVNRALTGLHGETFSPLTIETNRKASHDDVYQRDLTFGFILYDESAVPAYEQIEKPPLTIQMNVK